MSKRCSAISLPPAVVTDANVVLSALIKVFTTGDLLDALRDAGHWRKNWREQPFERRCSGPQRPPSTTSAIPKTQSRSYLMCMPLIARAITSCWISAVPSKMS
jgi:hypothetical protein